MKKLFLLIMLAVLISSTATAATQSGQDIGPNFVPGDLFYPLENFVEDIEVKVAGMVGGPDFKAKAIANNADETLREAKTLAERNQSEKASKMIEKYSKMMNKSRGLVDNSKNKNLSDKLQNISEKNIEVLEEVKQKVPEEARKGIDRAIEESKKGRKSPGDTGNNKRPESNEIPKKNITDPENNLTRPEKPENLTELPNEKPEKGLKDKNISNSTGKELEKEIAPEKDNKTNGDSQTGNLDERENNSSSKNLLTSPGTGLL